MIRSTTFFNRSRLRQNLRDSFIILFTILCIHVSCHVLSLQWDLIGILMCHILSLVLCDTSLHIAINTSCSSKMLQTYFFFVDDVNCVTAETYTEEICNESEFMQFFTWLQYNTTFFFFFFCIDLHCLEHHFYKCFRSNCFAWAGIRSGYMKLCR